MKRRIAMALGAALLLTGCGQMVETASGKAAADALPAVVFIQRVDRSDELNDMDPAEAAPQVAVYTLGFYDRNGDYYTCDDPAVNAMDNVTLTNAYEAGELTEKLHYVTSCDADALAEQYRSLLPLCRSDAFRIEKPMEMPAVEAESRAWHGVYYAEDGTLQSKVIHQEECMTSIYTDNETVNEVYDWINNTLHKN